MLIDLNHDRAAALLYEELQELYGKMREFCFYYGPQREDMEEDDEAAILLLDTALLLPINFESYLNAIRLIRYYIDEHCWQSDLMLEEKRLLLLERSYCILSREKRPRHLMRQWRKNLGSEKLLLL